MTHESLSSLKRSISPPPTSRCNKAPRKSVSTPTPSAVEAGTATITNHLNYFRSKLTPLCRLPTGLSIDAYAALFERNQHDHGRHFVIHQHSHPVAGIHYDMRLQFSTSSSVSWAVPYGMPGDPNSKRLTRLAVETRVHCLWNHLIESASLATGSLLIWDIGEYNILPRHTAAPETDSASSSVEYPPSAPSARTSEPQKLRAAFQDRHIRLRLHGTRLPVNYTLYLRLPRAEAALHAHKPSSTHPAPPRRRRRRRRKTTTHARSPVLTSDSDRSDDADNTRTAAAAAAGASDAEDAATVLRNAYPGAMNDIGSVHQRRWFLGLDRSNSGFVKRGARWERDGERGFESFYVQGSAVERSVVTGRAAADVLGDEGVEGFVERRRWKGITE